MAKIKLGNNDFEIKFGYEATLKSGIIKKIVEAEQSSNEDKAVTILLLIPEIILVGLQKFHKEEYGYNLTTNEGRDIQLDKVYELVEKYLEEENSDILELYGTLQKELLEESFLASLFKKELKKTKK